MLDDGKMEWFFFFLCSLKGGRETPLTTSTNSDTKSACPPLPSDSQGWGGSTLPKPQQYEDVGEMAKTFPASVKPSGDPLLFPNPYHPHGRQKTPLQPHPHRSYNPILSPCTSQAHSSWDKSSCACLSMQGAIQEGGKGQHSLFPTAHHPEAATALLPGFQAC